MMFSEFLGSPVVLWVWLRNAPGLPAFDLCRITSQPSALPTISRQLHNASWPAQVGEDVRLVYADPLMNEQLGRVSTALRGTAKK